MPGTSVTSKQVQERIVQQARAADVTEAAADKRHGQSDDMKRYRLSLKLYGNSEFFRGILTSVGMLESVGLYHAARRLAQYMSTIPPVCPKCGDPMTFESDTPADPTTGDQHLPAHWHCCGLRQRIEPPLDPSDEKDDRNVRPDRFEQE